MRLTPPSIRSLLKSPGFSLLVVVTLALGIGANTGVFSIVYALLLQPLPYKDPSRIVTLFESKSANELASSEEVSPANFVDWRERSQSFAEIAASYGYFSYNLTAGGTPQHVFGAAVSSNLFPLLGVQPALGRTFLPEEDSYHAPNVVVLSHRLWKSQLGGDRNVVGQAISINGDAYTVIGVMPAGWKYPNEDADIWIPLQRQIHPERMHWRRARFLHVIGRLRPGVTLEQARAEMNVISASIKQANPDADVDPGVVILPFRDDLVRDVRSNLLLALGIAGIVLLIACANAANLMLVRVTGKARDLAVRIALGASPGRVLRQPVIESLWLGIAAGVLGVLFALGGKKLLLMLAPAHTDKFQLIHLHPAVLGFTFLLSTLVGLIFGLIPAVAILRADLQDQLRTATRTITVDLKGRRLRHGLAIGEIALSVLLLIGAGLLLRSFIALRHVPLGFSPDHVITVRFSLPRIRYQNDRDVLAFYDRAMEAIRALTGVEEATLTTQFPLSGDDFGASFAIAGKTSLGQYETANLGITDAHYFSTLSIPLLRGRPFSEHDRAGSEPVVIVNETFARRFFSGQDSLGKHLTVFRGDDSQPHRLANIVGLVGDVRTEVASDAPPTIYVPHPQMPFHTMRFAVRTNLSLAELERSLRKAVQSVDPNQPVYEVNRLEDLVSDTLEPWRYALLLMGTLAVLALLLTLAGVFGVVSYLVSERTKELAIRVAMGATQKDVYRLVLGKGLQLSLGGILAGLAAAVIVTRFMRSMLYGISPNDSITFATVAALLGVTALLASYFPARRATRVDPATVLGEE